MSKHIVKHPGGVILHHADGISEYYAYGSEVDPDQLADYQRDTLGQYTDDNDRTAYQVERQAHKNAAFADSGQINSTSDPVPGNYGDLSEEEAAQLVMAINDQQVQARLLLHERLHGGSRQMVIDAGSPLATAIAETLFTHIEDGGHTQFAQTPVVDRERQLERESRKQEAAERKSGGAPKRSSASRAAKTPAPSGD